MPSAQYAPGYDPNKPPKQFGPPSSMGKFTRGEIFFWIVVGVILRAAGAPWIFALAGFIIFHFLWPTIRKAKAQEEQTPPTDDDLSR